MKKIKLLLDVPKGSKGGKGITLYTTAVDDPIETSISLMRLQGKIIEVDIEQPDQPELQPNVQETVNNIYQLIDNWKTEQTIGLNNVTTILQKITGGNQ